MEDGLEGSLAVLLLVTEVGEQERDAREFAVMLAIRGVVVGWVDESDWVWREDGVQHDHFAHGAVQAARAGCGDGVAMEPVQDGG